MHQHLLRQCIGESRTARLVAQDIWSVLPPDTPTPPYDGRAQLYDRLIGSRLYNRLAWGTDPTDYAAFAEQAACWGSGPLLDAGCGTLVSTAQVHAASNRPTLLVDLSIDMLRAAQDRLLAHSRTLPERIVLLQADITDLPFREGSFGAILCPGMLHLFDDPETITQELARVADGSAHIFATSLVAERWISRRYLALLHRAGEVAQPRTAAQLLARLNGPASGLATPVETNLTGSMAFLTARPA